MALLLVLHYLSEWTLIRKSEENFSSSRSYVKKCNENVSDLNNGKRQAMGLSFDFPMENMASASDFVWRDSSEIDEKNSE